MRLPAETFAAWLCSKIEQYERERDDPVAYLAERLGVSDRWVWRYSRQLTSDEKEVASTYDADWIEDHLWRADVFLWEVYPELEEPPLEDAGATLVATPVSNPAGPPLVPPRVDTRGRRNENPRGIPCRIPDETLVVLNRLHIERDMSARELGRQIWQRFGYASARSAAAALSTGWQRLGLARRDRVAQTRIVSTKHGLAPRKLETPAQRAYRLEQRRKRGEIQGRRCAGITRNGRCQKWSLRGKDFCRYHDPELRAEVLEHAAHARAS